MKKGFTLLELMIVVAIIGILAAIAITRAAMMIEFSKAKTIYTLDSGVRVTDGRVIEVNENYIKYKDYDNSIVEYKGNIKIQIKDTAVATKSIGNMKVLGGK